MSQWAEKMIPRRAIPKMVRHLTGGAKNPHEATVWRWYTKGVRGVRLEVTRIGGEVFTTETQLKLFFARTSEQADGRRKRVKPRQVALTKSTAQACAELEALGM